MPTSRDSRKLNYPGVRQRLPFVLRDSSFIFAHASFRQLIRHNSSRTVTSANNCQSLRSIWGPPKLGPVCQRSPTVFANRFVLVPRIFRRRVRSFDKRNNSRNRFADEFVCSNKPTRTPEIKGLPPPYDTFFCSADRTDCIRARLRPLDHNDRTATVPNGYGADRRG